MPSIGDDAQRRDRPQPPGALRVPAAWGRLLRCRSLAMHGIACVASPCIRPHGARNATIANFRTGSQMDSRGSKSCIVAILLLLLLGPAFSQGKTAPAKSGKPPAPPKAAPAPEPPKSPAERVFGVLQEFIVQADLHNRGGNPPEKLVRLSETDLNAYMQYAVTRKPRYGIQSVHIKLMGDNRLGATTTIDFDTVKVEAESLAVRMVRSLLSGEKQIYVEGVVTSDKGMGQFSLEKAYFGSVRLPVYFIEKVINFLGHRQTPPVDTSKPVPLPYGLKKLEVDDGSIVLRS